MSEENIFGVPHAEQLYDDPGTVYETDIEPWLETGRGPETEPVVIEEWTVHPPRYHVPPADRVTEWISEWIGENGEVSEDGFYAFENGCVHDDVKEAVERLLDLIASKVTYRMADEKVAEHIVSWDEQGEPLLDGKPMYVRAAASV